ncbi:MAG: MSMEG_6728 family protein [Terrabacter sp.]
MQTFVPYADFARTARVLDTKRLGKQRVEVIQIVRALTVPGYAWASHPAVLMWKGYEEALGAYGLAMCDEWIARGFGDTCATTIRADLATAGVTRLRDYESLHADGSLPPWLADEDVQRSHRSALVRKDAAHYAAAFPDVPTHLPYVWPVRSEAVLERERRQAEAARRREERAREKARRARSAAGRKAWETRRRRAQEAATRFDDATQRTAPDGARDGVHPPDG